MCYRFIKKKTSVIMQNIHQCHLNRFFQSLRKGYADFRQVPNTKFLGMDEDASLIWILHIEFLTEKRCNFVFKMSCQITS